MKKNSKKSCCFVRVSRIALSLAGFVACAAPTRNAESRPLRPEVGGYQVEVLVDGTAAQSFWHEGETFVLGHLGDRYTIRVSNHTSRRVEAVVSVDGRGVIDGKPGDFARKSGYLVPAWGQVEIDGWRLSQAQAAAFRFSSVADSYAARMGSARNVGVIGVAIFPERVYRPPPRPIYPAVPYRYDDEPRFHGYGRKGSGEDALGAAPAAPSSTSAPAPLVDKAPAAAKAERAAGEAYAPRRTRPGLGTEFGEAVSSQIREVEFVRANPSEPAALLGLRYNDRAGLIAMGIDVDGPWCCSDDSSLRRTADPFPVSHTRYARPPSGWREY
jgi:hypothetical protein